MALLKRAAFIIILCLAANWYAHAQETQTRILEFDMFAGSWKVTSETRLSSSGPWETNEGISVIKKSTGEALIEEDYSGLLQNKPFFTKSIIAFNHFTNKFQAVFIDSEHGVLIDFEGIKNADTIFFDKTWTYPNGSTVKLRAVYTIISPAEFKKENMRMPENSTTWDITGRMRYTRKR